jgi:hypothetical protein
MPRFLISNMSATNGGCCCDNSIDRNSAVFFNKLASKLMDMTQAIEKRIQDMSERCATPQKGFLLASIETPQMVLGVKYEYVEYIKRYGPPVKGKFDEALLEGLRIELGITNMTNTL